VPCSFHCSLWFLLLLGAGSVLLLVCLQDLTDTVLQHSPGQCFLCTFVLHQCVGTCQP